MPGVSPLAAGTVNGPQRTVAEFAAGATTSAKIAIAKKMLRRTSSSCTRGADYPGEQRVKLRVRRARRTG